MRFSMHTIIVSDYPTVGEHLLYHTRTQAMVKIHDQLKQTIDDFASIDDHQKSNYAADIEALHQTGIVVASEEEDLSHLKKHMLQLKSLVNRRSLPVTILTTYACNFKCTYCFEEASRTNEKMDHQTTEDVLNWLKSKVTEHGYQNLYITFYGGEPLVNKPALEKIAKHMQNWCRERNIGFRFLLQTNGYLMTPELIDYYLTLGLDQVRISVDGIGHEHDHYRPLRNGGGTFDVVMQNIVACAKKVKIGISVSYDKGEVDKIERLFDYFDELGVLHKLGRFLFSPLHATLGPEGHPELIQNSSCMCNYNDESLVDANRKIISFMKAKGLSMRSGMSTSICPVTSDETGVTIDQNGLLFKCNSMLGHPELSTGSVRDKNYSQKHFEFVHLDVWKQCPVDCTYMPMCSGGCRLSSFLNNKNFKTATCHKSYLNKMAAELIKKDYEALMAKNEASEPEVLMT